MMLFAGTCLRGTHLTFENVNWINLINLVIVKVSWKEDGTNLKYFEIKLQDMDNCLSWHSNFISGVFSKCCKKRRFTSSLPYYCHTVVIKLMVIFEVRSRHCLISIVWSTAKLVHRDGELKTTERIVYNE